MLHRALLVAAALLCADLALAAVFRIPSDESTTYIRFDSSAPLESFHGDTRLATGHIECDPAALSESLDVFLEVDMASLDTGIGKRNQDMRENHLETEKFPTATFRGARLVGEVPSSLPPGTPATVRMAGELTIHGVSRPREIDVELTYEEGPPRVHAVAKFSVDLDDHGISRPQFLFLKLSEVQEVTVDVVAFAGERRAAD